MVVGHRLLTEAARDVGVDGAALDWTGTDQRHLDDQVLDACHLDAEQHLNLGPALNLDDAQDVGALDHRVDLWVSEVDLLRPDDAPMTLLYVTQAAVQLVEARVAQQVELDEAGVRDRVLVPLTDVAAGHRRRFDRHLLIDAGAGDDDAAGVLAQVPRQAAYLFDQIEKVTPDRKAQTLGELRHILQLVSQRPGEAAVHAFRHLVDLALRQPQRLPDVAHGARVAVLNEGADHGGALRGVGLEDVLEHLGPRRAAEVDVDVRHVFLRPVLVEEALHRQVVLDRVDAGEAEQEADQGADGGAATAGRHLALVGVAQQVPEAKEEAGAFALTDQVELLIQPVLAPCWQGRTVVSARQAVARIAQKLVSAAAIRHLVVREDVGQVARKVEATAFGDANRVVERLRQVGEEALHLRGRLQVELRVGTQMGSSLFEVRPVSDGDEHVVEAMPLADVVVDVIRRDDAEVELVRQGDEALVTRLVLVDKVVLQLDEEALAAEDVAVARRGLERGSRLAALYQGRDLALATAGKGDEALGVLRQPLEAHARLAPRGAEVGAAEQAREVSVATRRLGEQRQMRFVRQRDLGAGDRPQVPRLRRLGELHRAGEVVVVGQS